MSQKTRLTEIRETYAHKKRIRNADGSHELKDATSTRYRDVNYVEGWPRFGAFLIDIVCVLIFEVAVGAAIGIGLVLMGRGDLLQDSDFKHFLTALTWLIIRPAFYVLFEGSVQATPAKLMLRRVVVNEYGEKPSFKQILARSYARLVPFEAFSCLGTLGWHDTWSNTFVLRKADLKDLQLAIRIGELDKPEEAISNSEMP